MQLEVLIVHSIDFSVKKQAHIMLTNYRNIDNVSGNETNKRNR